MFAVLSPDYSVLYYTAILSASNNGAIWSLRHSGSTNKWYGHYFSFAVNTILYVSSDKLFISSHTDSDGGTSGTFIAHALTDFTNTGPVDTNMAWKKDLRWVDDDNWNYYAGKSILYQSSIYTIAIFDSEYKILM